MTRFRYQMLLRATFLFAFLSSLAVWALVANLTSKIDLFKFEAQPDENMKTVSPLPSETGTDQRVSLPDALLREFQRRNSNLGKVSVVEMRPVDSGSTKHLVLSRATRENCDFRQSFEDELFGLFIVEANLNRVEKTLEFIPTPRWHDTEMRIEKLVSDHAVVVGKSIDYGHQLFRKKYEFRKLGGLSD